MGFFVWGMIGRFEYD